MGPLLAPMRVCVRAWVGGWVGGGVVVVVVVVVCGGRGGCPQTGFTHKGALPPGTVSNR